MLRWRKTQLSTPPVPASKEVGEHRPSLHGPAQGTADRPDSGGLPDGDVEVELFRLGADPAGELRGALWLAGGWSAQEAGKGALYDGGGAGQPPGGGGLSSRAALP